MDIFLKVEDFWRKHPVEEATEDETSATVQIAEGGSMASITDRTTPQ